MYPTDLTRPAKTFLLLQPAFEGPVVPLRPFRFLCTQLPFRARVRLCVGYKNCYRNYHRDTMPGRRFAETLTQRPSYGRTCPSAIVPRSFPGPEPRSILPLLHFEGGALSTSFRTRQDGGRSDLSQGHSDRWDRFLQNRLSAL